MTKNKATLLATLCWCFFASTVAFAQAVMWGNTLEGGTNNIGVVFKTNADGTGFTLEKQFVYTTTIKGEGPQGQPILGVDGNFYGVTAFGGTYNRGILFKFDPTTSTFTQLHDFGSVANDGISSIGSVMQASNGKLYGMAQRGGTASPSAGILFEYDLNTGTYTIKHSFGVPGTDGNNPGSNMIEAVNGKLYGMTSFSGTSGTGTIFEYDPATSTYTMKLEFVSLTEGAQPYGDLVAHSNGKLYGMTQYTDNDLGTIFEYVPGATTITVKATLDANTGGNAWGSLTEAGNNKLYGLTYYGGTNNLGTLIEFDPASGNVTKKVDFDGASKGKSPFGSLALSLSGTLFGMTPEGGANNFGTLFEYDPATGAFTKKRDLDQTSGSPIYGAPFFNANGKMYGMNNNGGTNNTGVIYEYDPASNTFTTMLNFGAAIDGKNPSNGLTQALNGKFYSVTEAGGTMEYGTIYELDPANSAFTKKADFNRQNGWFPNTEMLLASNGKLYGIAQIGGATNDGVIYEFDPATGILTKKIDLLSSTTGDESFAGFIEVSYGKLYAVLRTGGPLDNGTLIEYDFLSNTVAVKHNFDLTNGGSPTSVPIMGANGKLYGVANGPQGNGGILYEFDPATSTYTKKKDFHTGGVLATFPRGSMTLANNGKMYGLTLAGGVNNGGAIYEYDPATNTLTDKYSFPFQTPSGYGLFGTMTLSPNGKLYGGTQSGGTNDLGIFFEYDPATSTFSKLFDFDGTNGAAPSRTRLAVLKNTQTITFNSLAAKTYGDAAFTLGATASSGLAIVYSSSNPAVATVSGNTVTVVGAGTATITASQRGNISYLVAQSVSQTLSVNKAPQTITFNTIPDKTLTDAPFAVTASSTSSLAVLLTTASDKVTISGSQITLVKPGRVTITAGQTGSANIAPAPNVNQSFCIKPAKPVITISGTGTASPTLTSSATSGNQWFLNGTAISGATNTTVAVAQAGTYKVQSTADDCVSDFSADQAVVITGDLAKEAHSDLILYPNPTKNILVVSLPDVPGRKLVSIYHSDGRAFDAGETSGKELSFQVSDYANGLYLIKVITEKSFHTARFIKE